MTRTKIKQKFCYRIIRKSQWTNCDMIQICNNPTKSSANEMASINIKKMTDEKINKVDDKVYLLLPK